MDERIDVSTLDAEGLDHLHRILQVTGTPYVLDGAVIEVAGEHLAEAQDAVRLAARAAGASHASERKSAAQALMRLLQAEVPELVASVLHGNDEVWAGSSRYIRSFAPDQLEDLRRQLAPAIREAASRAGERSGWVSNAEADLTLPDAWLPGWLQASSLDDPPVAVRIIESSLRSDDARADGSAPRKRRKWIAVAAVVGALAAVAILGAFFVLRDESTADRYLAALETAGLRSEFAGEKPAIANAESVCQAIDGGDKPQGSEVDRIGVEHYCSEYFSEFKVLETTTVSGTFSIADNLVERLGNRFISPNYTDGVGGCEGDGGYSDLNASTTVLVTNDAGDVLARTSLGQGKDTFIACEFTFSFEITEGEERYVLSVGRRGESAYTWEEITERGAVELGIGF